MGASRPAAVRPKWSSTTAKMPLEHTAQREFCAHLMRSFSPTVLGGRLFGRLCGSFLCRGRRRPRPADASPGRGFLQPASAGWAAPRRVQHSVRRPALPVPPQGPPAACSCCRPCWAASVPRGGRRRGSRPSPSAKEAERLGPAPARASVAAPGRSQRPRPRRRPSSAGPRGPFPRRCAMRPVSTPSTSCGGGRVRSSGRAGLRGRAKSRALSSCHLGMFLLLLRGQRAGAHSFFVIFSGWAAAAERARHAAASGSSATEPQALRRQLQIGLPAPAGLVLPGPAGSHPSAEVPAAWQAFRRQAPASSLARPRMRPRMLLWVFSFAGSCFRRPGASSHRAPAPHWC